MNLQVDFRTKKLKRRYQTSDEAVRARGTKVGRKYIERVNIIKQVKNIDELAGMPALHFHELKGSRAGQYAVNLTEYDRLIVRIEGQVVTIEEVSGHYGD